MVVGQYHSNMANQPEISEFTAGIYQYETTDEIEGGAGGKLNLPWLQLANRTKWLKDNLSLAFTGDVKEVDCTNAYISANFDATGLGKNERIGWAICNGNNGTRNRNGRTSIAYGTSYGNMGDTGGSKNSVVVSHSHTYTQYDLGQEVSSNGDGIRGLNKNNSQAGAFTTSTSGESGVGKNLQPYIVSLFIQKL